MWFGGAPTGARYRDAAHIYLWAAFRAFEISARRAQLGRTRIVKVLQGAVY